MLDIRIVDVYLRTHFGQFPDKEFASTVTCVADILPVTCTTHYHIRRSDVPPHIAK